MLVSLQESNLRAFLEIKSQRSTKKVKEDHPPGSTTVAVGGLVRETLSYKARLVGELPGAYA